MPPSKRSRTSKAKLTKKERAGREQAQTAAARHDVNAASGDNAFGTGNAAMGTVKMQSEEARMETCFECGYARGRHAFMCSRRPAE